MRDSFDILDGDVPLDTLTKAEAVKAYYDAYLSESLAYYDSYSSYWWVSSEEIYDVAEKLFGVDFLKFLDDKIKYKPYSASVYGGLLCKKSVRIRKDGKAYKSDLETRKRELKTKYLT